jgi:antitoxin (DNA-binding transcriptional repressor) of toxin-antitoxin stability system
LAGERKARKLANEKGDEMSNPVSIEDAARDLKGLLAQLSLGETVTLADDDGKPLALLVSLHPEQPSASVSDPYWIEKWYSLASEVDVAWQGEESAVETLSEMRR